MRADHNVNQSFFEVFQRFFLFCCRAETAEQIHTHRIIFHPLDEIIIMLLGKDGRRHQKYHLFALLCRLERRTDRHFRLAISDIAADQAIHDLIALHIVFHRFDRLQLIVRLIKRKRLFELFLPDRVLSIAESLFPLSRRIKLHQIFCNIFNCTAYSCLDTSPLLRPQFVQFRAFCLRICIFLDDIELRCRHIKVASAGILHLHVIFCDFIDFYFFNPAVNAESVVFMHHVITDRKL